MASHGAVLSYLVHQPSTLLMEGGAKASADALCKLQLPCNQLTLLDGLHIHSSSNKSIMKAQEQ
jgi:hypothetical protein